MIDSAFPVIRSTTNEQEQLIDVFSEGGLKIRDYFAGQALCALCSNLSYADVSALCETIVRTAYEIADGMVRERQKTSPPPC